MKDKRKSTNNGLMSFVDMNIGDTYLTEGLEGVFMVTDYWVDDESRLCVNLKTGRGIVMQQTEKRELIKLSFTDE